jgi:hypothetical protein
VYATGVLITQSDERKKKEIEFLNDGTALQKLHSLRGCTYEMNSSGVSGALTLASASSNTREDTQITLNPQNFTNPAPTLSLTTINSSASSANLMRPGDEKRRHMGLLAQDVLRTCPEAVYQDPNGFYSIAYGNLVGIVVEAIKELDARVGALEKS